MPDVRSMLLRVRKLEAARAAPLSPFELSYGSLAGFEDVVRADVDAGKLDRRDMLGEDGNGGILACIRRWHVDRVWDDWRKQRNNFWQHGG